MRKTIIAKDGYMLTDGQAYVKIVDLAEGDNGDKWYEITEAEYNEKMKAEELANGDFES